MGEGKPTGGSKLLAELIDQYGGALYPDLKHYFGFDLRQLFDDDLGITPGLVLMMIVWLPLESQYVAQRRGGAQFRGWNASWYAQVAQVNSLRGLSHAYVLTHIGKNATRPKAPESFPVPQEKTEKPPVARPGSFAAMAGSMIATARRRKAGG